LENIDLNIDIDQKLEYLIFHINYIIENEFYRKYLYMLLLFFLKIYKYFEKFHFNLKTTITKYIKINIPFLMDDL